MVYACDMDMFGTFGSGGSEKGRVCSLFLWIKGQVRVLFVRFWFCWCLVLMVILFLLLVPDVTEE